MGYVNSSYSSYNHLFEKFFHKFVAIPFYERQQHDTIVKNIVDKLFEKVQQSDNRFCKVVPVGSSTQRLKTTAPDEYDINVVINKPSELKKRDAKVFSDTADRCYDFRKNVVGDENKNFKHYHKTMANNQAAECLIVTGIFFLILCIMLAVSTAVYARIYGFGTGAILLTFGAATCLIISISTCKAGCCGMCPEGHPYRQLDELILVEEGQLSDSDCIVSSAKSLPKPGNGDLYFSLNKAELDSGTWDNWTFNGDLIPVRVKNRLKDLLMQAARDLSLEMEFEQGGSGTAVTCTLSHQELKHQVSLDFSPVLQNIAPLRKRHWRTGKRYGWPRPHTISKLQEMGVSLVPRNDFHWKISMTMLEVELMENMHDDRWTNGCRRKSHRILKKLNEKFFCQSSKPVICSYVLKNILFWQCEKFTKGSNWEQGRLAECIIRMTEELLDGVQKGFVPSYISPDINVLRVKNKEALLKAERKIEDFLSDPEFYMNQIIYSQGQMYTNVC